MREPLDLSRPRTQVCAICHDRGWYPGGGEKVVSCDCNAGRAVAATEDVRRRLSRVFSTRDVELWLQSRIPALRGERPINLLREGREDEVFSVMARIPGMPSAEEEDVRIALAEPVQSTLLVKPPEDAEAVRRVLKAKLRQAGERRIADAMDRDELQSLSDRERAVLDAALFGSGFLVAGKRVDPVDVEVVRWPG